MSRSETFGLSTFIAYVVGVFITWGSIWNHLPECGKATPQTTIAESTLINDCHGDNAIAVFFGSMFWPVYVLGRFGAELTK